MSGHTPGPWVAVFNGHYWQVDPADRGPEDPWQIGDVCASNPGNPASELQKANARLIAAAPDLLAACKAASVALGKMSSTASAIGIEGTSDWDHLAGGSDLFGTLDTLRAAIAKAEQP